MADGKQIIKVRTESHSDVADSPAARQHQAAMTERQFGETLLRFLRDAKGDVHLRHLKEEFVTTDDGLTHEISVEAVADETA